MTYDAVLVARRGIGVEEERLASRAFADAVRWAAFAERLAPVLDDTRETVATDPPKGLEGSRLTAFIAERGKARERLKSLEAVLYPPDGAGDG